LGRPLRSATSRAFASATERTPSLISASTSRGPGYRCHGPSAGERRWQTIGAFGQDEARSCASALAGNEQMHGARRLRHPPHSVQFERVESGENGAIAA
jgi:hypothetical protein